MNENNLRSCSRCRSNSLSIFQASKNPPFLWNNQEYFNVKCTCGLNGPKSLSEDGAIFGWNADTWFYRITIGELLSLPNDTIDDCLIRFKNEISDLKIERFNATSEPKA